MSTLEELKDRLVAAKRNRKHANERLRIARDNRKYAWFEAYDAKIECDNLKDQILKSK